MDRQQLIDLYWQYEDAAGHLKLPPYTDHMDEEASDDAVDDMRSASDQAQTPLSPGTCFGGLTVIGGEEATAGIADCDRPHFWEAYAGGVLSAATETPSYRLAQLDPTVRATCTKDALAAYLGAPPQGYVREVLPPSVIDWSAGGRTFVCLAAKRGAGEVSHPLR